MLLERSFARNLLTPRLKMNMFKSSSGLYNKKNAPKGIGVHNPYRHLQTLTLITIDPFRTLLLNDLQETGSAFCEIYRIYE